MSKVIFRGVAGMLVRSLIALAGGILLSLCVIAQTPSNAQILSQFGRAYARSAAEISAGIEPSNLAYAVFNCLRYGCDPTGNIDSTNAIQNAVYVARVNGGQVYIPTGTYKTTATINTGDYTGVFIKGDGPQATIIKPTSALGSNPVLQFGITTGGANQGFSDLAIMMANAPSATAVTTNNLFGFWARNFLIQQANIGIQINGGVIEYFSDWQINQTISYVVNIVGGNDDYFEHGVASNVGYVQAVAGFNVHSTGGIWLTDLDIIEQGTGFLCDPTTGQTVDWVFGNNIAFDTNAQSGIAIEPSGTGACNGIDFTASWASSASGFGVFLGGSGVIDGVRLNGVRVFNNQGHGIALGSSATISNVDISNSDIAGNGAPIANWSSTVQYSTGNNVRCCSPSYANYFTATASSLNHTPPNTSYWSPYTYAQNSGFFAASGASGFSLIGNRIGASNGQLNTQLYGIDISAGSSNNYTIQGNDLRGNSTGMSELGTGANKIVSGNLGYNPIGTTSISVGASPFTFTNTTGGPVVVVMYGGAVTAVEINSLPVTNADGVAYTIQQGGTYAVSYTSAPTMAYYGLN